MTQWLRITSRELVNWITNTLLPGLWICSSFILSMCLSLLPGTCYIYFYNLFFLFLWQHLTSSSEEITPRCESHVNEANLRKSLSVFLFHQRYSGSVTSGKADHILGSDDILEMDIMKGSKGSLAGKEKGQVCISIKSITLLQTCFFTTRSMVTT